MSNRRMTRIQKSRSLQIAAIIFVISLFWRFFYSTQIVSFSQDQARDVMIMRYFAEQKQWIVGYGAKTSVGSFFVPPFYYQLNLLVAAVAGHKPLAMKWFITFVEAGTAVIVYAILKRFVTEKSAITLALLYTVSFLPTAFGTVAWNPALIPFFSTLALWGWMQYYFSQKKWGIVVGTVATSLVFHFHFQAAILLPFMGLIFIYSVLKHKLSILPYWLLSAILSLGVILPYLIADFQNSWHNTRSMLFFLTAEHSRYYDVITPTRYVTNFLPAFFERVLFGTELPQLFFGRLLLGGLISLTLLSIKHIKLRFILLYMLILMITLRFYKGVKLDYYLSIIFIVPIILLAQFEYLLKRFYLPLLIVVVFVVGYRYQTVSVRNEITQLEKLSKNIEFLSPTRQATVIKRGDVPIHKYVFGLEEYSNVDISSKPTTLIEVCSAASRCGVVGDNICTSSAYESSLQQYLAAANYKPLVFLELLDDTHIYIGTVNGTELPPELPREISQYLFN